MKRISEESYQCDTDNHLAGEWLKNKSTYLRVNNSRQKSALMRGLERGPNAFLPMSEYVRKRGLARMMRPNILALNTQSKNVGLGSEEVVYGPRITSH